MPQGKTRGGNLEVVSTDHQTTCFQIRPQPRVAARLGEIEGLHEQGSEDLLHMPLAPCSTSGILCSLDAMKQFGGRDGCNERLGSGELPQESQHVELCPFVGDQDRGVQDQSHAVLRGGGFAWACSRSSAKEWASSGDNFSSLGQRSANSAQVMAAPGNGLSVATGLPSLMRIADSRRRSTRSSTPRKSLAASATEMAVSLI